MILLQRTNGRGFDSCGAIEKGTGCYLDDACGSRGRCRRDDAITAVTLRIRIQRGPEALFVSQILLGTSAVVMWFASREPLLVLDSNPPRWSSSEAGARIRWIHCNQANLHGSCSPRMTAGSGPHVSKTTRVYQGSLQVEMNERVRALLQGISSFQFLSAFLQHPFPMCPNNTVQNLPHLHTSISSHC